VPQNCENEEENLPKSQNSQNQSETTKNQINGGRMSNNSDIQNISSTQETDDKSEINKKIEEPHRDLVKNTLEK